MIANLKAAAIFVGFLVLCIVSIGFLGNIMAPQTTAPTDTSIAMIQPCQWWQVWCSNTTNAQYVNLPNSQSNQYNGERILAEAQAEAIRKQAETDRLQQQADYANSPGYYRLIVLVTRSSMA